MKRATCVLVALALLLGGAGRVQAGPTLWIDDANNNLGTVDAATGNVLSLVHISGTAGVLTDIAYSPSGKLYGTDFTSLYTINTTTGAATLVGSLTLNGANALVFSGTGILYAAANNTNNLYRVNTSTGLATSIGSVGQSSAGDLAFVGSTLYEADTNGHLNAITLNASGTSVTTAVQAANPFGFTNVFGLASPGNGTLYGDAGTEIFTVNLSTGVGTLVSNYSGNAKGLSDANGTAFFSEAGAPEPSTLALLCIGAALLAGYCGWKLPKRCAPCFVTGGHIQ